MKIKKGQHLSIKTEFKKGLTPWHKGKHQWKGRIHPMLGKKHTKEAREKMSKTWFKKGQISWNKGKKTPGIGRNKIIKKGKLNGRWKGGITPLNQIIRHCFKYRQWISDIFSRDNFTCQKCEVRGGRLNAHHINEFSKIMKENKIKTLENALNCEELWNINNGITLCKKCHIR